MDALAGKHLVILGLARQGVALARYAAGVGARVTVSDLRSAAQLAPQLAALADGDIRFVLEAHPLSLLDGADLLAISGGVPLDAPLVVEALARGIPLTNDSREFQRRSPAPVVGITGSAGKTTTTALTGLMGEKAGRRTWVGGNIGRPLIGVLAEMAATDFVVQELSSFQLEIWRESPPVAAVLNVTPNHLDRHRTMAAYTGAKANILRWQRGDDIAVLCADDDGARAMAVDVQGRLRWFSRETAVDDGAFLRAGQIVLRDGATETTVCAAAESRLRGAHNQLNVLAAVTLADSAGIPAAAQREAIAAFSGVEHRLERVATVNNVAWINDSIATSPERALAALAAFDEPLILLAGGRDKAMVWDEWARVVRRRVDHAILFGELGPQLEAQLTGGGSGPEGPAPARPLDVRRVTTLDEAVAEAASLATAGDVVLLSPGGTSFDAFPDFAARGVHFRDLVAALQAVVGNARGMRME